MKRPNEVKRRYSIIDMAMFCGLSKTPIHELTKDINPKCYSARRIAQAIHYPIDRIMKTDPKNVLNWIERAMLQRKEIESGACDRQDILKEIDNQKNIIAIADTTGGRNQHLFRNLAKLEEKLNEHDGRF